MSQSEQALVSAAAAGDERAFAQILEAHRDMVYTMCYRTLGNNEDAEEAFQDTFVSAFRNLPSFRGDSKLSTWLYRIALNRCRDFLSSKRAKQDRRTTSIDDASDLRGRLSKDTGGQEAAETVGEALAFLPDEYRTAINLHCIMGYSYDEAGDIMGVPGGTVKTLVHRGKNMLRDVLCGED
jgi:RNA polymerase sigma-70 factor (ECF subfamily)